MERRIR